ncbi:MAG: WSD1 family O-acyltransferase, partial [Actinomycetia bacterium]|nr:WSD1 family O-acyltransferase [Actinomycetes bacterium]
MIAELPTHLDDPLQRLQAVHDAMVSAKEMHNAVPAHLLQDFSQFTAPAAAELVARAAAELRWADHMQAPFNVCISNVPGPRETLYYAGAEMLANFPFSMISDGMGLNITLQSYRDSLDFGLVSTPELIPDLWTLIDHLKIELAALVERAEAEGIEVGDPPTGPPDAEMKERHPDPRDVEAAAPPAKRAAAKKPAAAKKAAASKPAAAKKAAASKKPAARRTGPRNVQPPATEG